ncbi:MULTISPECIES: NAD(P)/FAD-dependent oxidoreductase [Streptomycetaceae]|uniref:FAD dependent oxidoreductase domain-containing protein n=1 Tax=Streptantibioticus cattleyicolor (strain ATCC 35852 / DSM 46488 / JCM 4925 / NBRC 14057 / NRRL 8057) TaxID=1003195 RepID=F8JS75_STREN|nr:MULTISPECIES: FAD-dependent oxidoreductase [Streptomycetaceae]AEW94186.1 hypothetical protein SCATT_18150 [Streptantibioticus cattleyicolor NRRL 8057 = DSM 46488]MYS58846.1 FAD-dependent oxidoreductase [Streptomyces sp. SID5468]CCB74540.1 conserved protein of unknown function [Streptantibioticus cattleyicolor NRRL 8057 = DSM 46488]
MTAPAAAVVVVGGGFGGLATAWALAERGLRVRVLDRSAPPPEGPAHRAAWTWRRPTVPQNTQSHVLTSLGVRLLRERLPRVYEAVLAAGARPLDLTAAVPATARGFVRQPSDDDLVALAVRRPVLELALYRAVRALPGVEVSHGATVRALELDPAGRRVRAVVTGAGERIEAPVVVDASGRRALSAGWLAAAGVPVAPDATCPNAFRAISRLYRLADPARLPAPLNRGNAAGGIFDHFAAVVHLADNGLFALNFAVLPDDPATDALLTPAGFAAAARITPQVAAWVDERVAAPVS